MGRPTVHDIARHACVSLATVDRVLNERPGVRAETIARVQQAVRDLGYMRDVHAANLARQREYRFVFALPETRSKFMEAMAAEVRRCMDTQLAERCHIELLRLPANDTHQLVTALGRVDPAATDGLALMAPETPRLRDAVVHLRETGVAVVPIVSDLPNSGCGHFVGINNVGAGRTAGLLLGRFAGRRDGTLAVLAGTMTSRDHAERRLGFDQVIREQFPDLAVLPTIECWDRAELVEARARGLLARRDDLVGIYAIGAGNSGLARAVSECAGRSGCRRPAVIVHELTEVSSAALRADLFDAVIAQDVGHIVRSAIRVLRAANEGRPIDPAQERIRTEIFVKENLPDATGTGSGRGE